MNLYLISWCEGDYDSYDGAVVCAENEEDAKNIHPSGRPFVAGSWSYDWAKHRKDISVRLIGTAVLGARRGVELASYNAG